MLSEQQQIPMAKENTFYLKISTNYHNILANHSSFHTHMLIFPLTVVWEPSL